jgi:hypothetical protein
MGRPFIRDDLLPFYRARLYRIRALNKLYPRRDGSANPSVSPPSAGAHRPQQDEWLRAPQTDD